MNQKKIGLLIFCKFISTVDGSSEYYINTGSIYFYDFTIRSDKIIFEYNGEMFHPNPKWKEYHEEKWDNWRQLFSPDRDAECVFNHDTMKCNCAEEAGFIIIKLWSSDSIKYNLDKCINIIKEIKKKMKVKGNIKLIEDGFSVDIETENTHTYQLGNGCVVHNTSSILLNTASGIHPRHAKKYFRRIQANKQDPVYMHFKENNPQCCEPSVWSTNNTDDVITFCVESPKDAITKDDVSALEFLEIVKNTQENWVLCGTAKPEMSVDFAHNVSNTCTVKDDEWDAVAEYIYENREYFTGVALLSESGDVSYKQAPHQQLRTHDDEAQWSNFLESYEKVDYTKLNESDDVTDHKSVIVCAGGTCDISINV